MIFRLEFPRILGGFLGQADDHVDHGLERLMTGHDGAQHGFFRQLFGFGFHHHHRVGRAGDHQVQLGVVHLGDGRVDDVLAILVAHARCADRTQEGQTGQAQGGGGADHADHIGIIFQIVAEHGDHHLGVVLEPLGEERADRTVNEARGQRLFVGRTAFALEIAARDLAGGEVFFLVIDGQREEVHARLDVLLCDRRREDGGFAIGGEHRAIRLTRHAAGFEGQRAAGPFNRFGLDIEHVSLVRTVVIRRRRIANAG